MYVNGLCDSDFKEQIYFLKILSVMQVTVLMPIYNAEKYLRDAIDSLLLSNFQGLEVDMY